MNTNKRYVLAKISALALSASLFAGGLTSCSNTNSNSNQTATTNKQNYAITEPFENKNSSTSESLESIDATFSHTRWSGVEYVKINEADLLEIIKVAMADAEKMYLSICANNMNLDKATLKPTEKFYPDWMNEYFFLARAKRESGNYMIDYVGPVVDEQGNRAVGIMCVVPEYIIPTLNDYMKNTYNSNITFSDYKLTPNQNDLNNFENSKTARENLKQVVYNDVFVSICYDIYNAKCLGPNHTDYYEKFGGYDEEIRQKVVTALYLFKRNDVISSLKNGTFLNEFANTTYVKDILNFQKEFSANYSLENSGFEK